MGTDPGSSSWSRTARAPTGPSLKRPPLVPGAEIGANGEGLG